MPTAVQVIATSREGTREALRAANAFAQGSSKNILLFVRPSRRAAVLPPASELANATVLSYEGGRAQDLLQLIRRSVLVVVGGRTRLVWPTPEQRLARTLTRSGCRVAFAHVAEPSHASRSRRARAMGASSPNCVASSGDT